MKRRRGGKTAIEAIPMHQKKGWGKEGWDMFFSTILDPGIAIMIMMVMVMVMVMLVMVMMRTLCR